MADKPQKEAPPPEEPIEARTNPQNVRLDTAQLKSTYCNVCNATSTREEVVLNFGLNQTWDLQNSDFAVALHHRIILSPHAAKRLQTILTDLLDQHEKRYGPLG